jgi:hypothetical protein
MAVINLPNNLTSMFEDINKRLRKLEKTSNTSVYGSAGTPPSAKDGDLWIDTTTNTFKIKINGVVKTITIV